MFIQLTCHPPVCHNCSETRHLTSKCTNKTYASVIDNKKEIKEEENELVNKTVLENDIQSSDPCRNHNNIAGNQLSRNNLMSLYNSVDDEGLVNKLNSTHIETKTDNNDSNIVTYIPIKRYNEELSSSSNS